MSSNVKTIGVIGLGSIGMRHAKNLLAMGHTVYGYDPAFDGGIRDDIYCGDNLNWLLSDLLGCDGIIVASPTPHHLDHFSAAVLQNRPVLVEKPIADKWTTAVEEMLARVKVPVMVGNNLRFHSCVKWAKENLELIGDPFWASFTVSQKNTKYTDPVLLNWGAHEIDLALYLLGSATVVMAYGGPVSIDVGLAHSSSLHSMIHCDYLAPVERRGFCILGDKGNIGVDLANRIGSIKAVDGYADVCLPKLSAPEGEIQDTWDQDYVDEMQAFIDLIDGKPVPHAATGQDGLAVLEIMLEAQRIVQCQMIQS